jgi:hypothetical protein
MRTGQLRLGNLPKRRIIAVFALLCLVLVLFGGAKMITRSGKSSLSPVSIITNAIKNVSGGVVLGASSHTPNNPAKPGNSGTSNQLATQTGPGHGGSTQSVSTKKNTSGPAESLSSALPIHGSLVLSESDASMKLSKSAPDLYIQASNGDLIGDGFPAFTDSLSPKVYIEMRDDGSRVAYASQEDLMINANMPTTAVGTHVITITVKGEHGTYSGTITIHVLPPPVYTVSISRQWQDSPFGYIELTAIGDPDYDIDNLTGNALTLENVPPEFDCAYYNQYDYQTNLTSGSLLTHWRCQNVGSAPPAVYVIIFKFEDQYGTTREVPVTFNDLGD